MSSLCTFGLGILFIVDISKFKRLFSCEAFQGLSRLPMSFAPLSSWILPDMQTYPIVHLFEASGMFLELVGALQKCSQ